MSTTTTTTKDAPVQPDAEERARAKKRAQARAALMRQTLRWHWISAALSLVGMLLFAATGITLNHAGQIKAEPKTVTRDGLLPEALRGDLRKAEAAEGQLPPAVRAWLGKEMQVKAPAGPVEWAPGEAYVALPGPGSDGGVTIDTATGDVAFERTQRGAVAYLNDLHKGRNTGPAWAWFIDIFAAACVVFCVTGLILLQLHSKARKSTWPLVGAGLLIPLLLAIFLIH
ncbi:MAG: PepSY-associated TM helix domain-containing protein [Pseudomonadota bacterium]